MNEYMQIGGVIIVIMIILWVIYKQKETYIKTDIKTDNINKLTIPKAKIEEPLINNMCKPRTDEWYYAKNIIDPIMYMDNTRSWWYYDRDREKDIQIKPDTQSPMSDYDQDKYLNAFGYDYCGKTDYRKSKPAGRLLNTKIPYLN